MKLSIYKYKLSYFLLLFINSVNGQSYDYELIYFDSEKIYHSIVQNEGTLFFGTNEGIYRLDEGAQLVEYDLSVKGAISSELNPESISISFITVPKNIPLNEFANSVTAIQSFQKYIFIISRGKLFVFQNKLYLFTPYESVRSITENYIGSYNGIYKNGKVLTYPRYTNGQIKEFDEITFICYDGLFAIRGDQQNILYDAPAGNRKYGAVENIFKLQNDNYLVVSD